MWWVMSRGQAIVRMGVAELSVRSRSLRLSAHANAPMTVEGRHRLIGRYLDRPIAHGAAEMGISRATASKWVNRYRHHLRASLGEAEREYSGAFCGSLLITCFACRISCGLPMTYFLGPGVRTSGLV